MFIPEYVTWVYPHSSLHWLSTTLVCLKFTSSKRKNTWPPVTLRIVIIFKTKCRWTHTGSRGVKILLVQSESVLTEAKAKVVFHLNRECFVRTLFQQQVWCQLSNLVALFSLLPLRSSTFVSADEASQALLSSASLLLFVESVAKLGWATAPSPTICCSSFLACTIIITVLYNLNISLLMEPQSFHSSVPGCLEEETWMTPLGKLSHCNSK